MNILLDYEYPSASWIAEKIKVSSATVYKIIRLMKEEDNVGILSAKKGYVLAEFAKHSDDVHFIRRATSTYTSNVITMNAARKHIQSRWAQLPQGKEVLQLTNNYSGHSESLRKSIGKLDEIKKLDL